MITLQIDSEDFNEIFRVVEQYIADHRGENNDQEITNLERILNNIAFSLADGIA